MGSQIHKYKMSIELETLKNLARLHDLKARDYRVLIYLMSHIDSTVPRKINKKHIRRELDMDKKEFNQALDTLVHAAILYKSDLEEDSYVFNE